MAKKTTPLPPNTCAMVRRASQYVGKGIADGAYAQSVGGDRVPTRLLEGMDRFLIKHCGGRKRR